MDYYKAAPAGNSMTVISTLTGEYLYLIEGTSSALLVDVSTGVGNLPAFVQHTVTSTTHLARQHSKQYTFTHQIWIFIVVTVVSVMIMCAVTWECWQTNCLRQT